MGRVSLEGIAEPDRLYSSKAVRLHGVSRFASIVFEDALDFLSAELLIPRSVSPAGEWSRDGLAAGPSNDRGRTRGDLSPPLEEACLGWRAPSSFNTEGGTKFFADTEASFQAVRAGLSDRFKTAIPSSLQSMRSDLNQAVRSSWGAGAVAFKMMDNRLWAADTEVTAGFLAMAVGSTARNAGSPIPPR